jgi:SAM-dependent methyltransferase
MTNANTDAWDRVAARRSAGDSIASDTVHYGPDLPSDDDLRLIGDVKGKRVLDLGCGSGQNAIALSRQGAHAIALDLSKAQLALARKLADVAEVRVEWHESDVADLAFLRADSIDLALAVGVLGEVDDLDRCFRQVHRVLRPGAPFVFSVDHPIALTVGREGATPGALALGALEVRRSYFDTRPVDVYRDDEQIRVYPRTVADVFAGLHRAGYRVDVLLEPEAVQSSDPGPTVPTTMIWRARKEGV